MSKTLGSITFGTTEMRTDEVVLFAEVANENGKVSPEEIMADIHLIDDLLCIQKIECLVTSQRFTKTGRLKKNSSLLDLIEGRLQQEIDNRKS